MNVSTTSAGVTKVSVDKALRYVATTKGPLWELTFVTLAEEYFTPQPGTWVQKRVQDFWYRLTLGTYSAPSTLVAKTT